MSVGDTEAARPPVVVVGSLHRDLTLRVPHLPAAGETLLAAGRVDATGGKGANQAVAVARCGVEVGLVAAVGDDPDGAAALADLRAAGVDVAAVGARAEPTGRAFVLVDRHGENSIVVDAGASGALAVADVTAAAEVVGAARVVVLQCEVPEAANLAAAELATGRVVLTPAPARPLPEALLSRVDVLVPNRAEAAQLAGAATPASLGEARALVTRVAPSVPSVLLTLGADGVLVRHGGAVTHVPAHPAAVVDTTGAGDAFTGAVVAELARDRSLLAAVEVAVRYAAAAVATAGAAPPPRIGPALPRS